MAAGGGRYEDECTAVRAQTGGSVVLLVFGGHKGEGFSVQTDVETLLTLPETLEDIARQLRADRAVLIGRTS